MNCGIQDVAIRLLPEKLCAADRGLHMDKRRFIRLVTCVESAVVLQCISFGRCPESACTTKTCLRSSHLEISSFLQYAFYFASSIHLTNFLRWPPTHICWSPYHIVGGFYNG